MFIEGNDDGVRQLFEHPLANIEVFLLDSNSVAVATNRTDAAGRYAFNRLRPDQYRVEVGPVPAGFSLGAEFSNPTPPIQLMSAETRLGEDVGFVVSNPSEALIGDYVWSDANGDGIQQAEEPGISGIQLLLFGPGGDGRFDTPDDALEGFALTSSAGHYLFSGLTPGVYRVVVFDGFGSILNSMTRVAGPQSYAGFHTTSPLAAGEVRMTADFGYSGANGQVGDRVFLDLNGNGIFDNGETGIGGVTVNLLADDGSTILATTETDGTGRYRFVGLLPRSYFVELSDLNNMLADLTQTFGSSGVNDHGQILPYPFTVAFGQTHQSADFGFAPPFGSLGNEVFLDGNSNVTFEPELGELGVVGVGVSLKDGAHRVIATRATGARIHAAGDVGEVAGDLKMIGEMESAGGLVDG
ncbi:MAG: SdrD B-like domain-containing protein, partial [Verrucomicrobiota bacterium]